MLRYVFVYVAFSACEASQAFRRGPAQILEGSMIIRRATREDLPRLIDLLNQVLMVHYEGRPDLFRPHTRKYTDEQLCQILADETRPVFVAYDASHPSVGVVGYVFCIAEDFSHSNNMQPIQTLYIDDLCVDEHYRGDHIGTALYKYVLGWARSHSFYNVTLNVWCCNLKAMDFYRSLGLTPYKVGMEQVL
jgi:ribosomal protein S18 acetylase RimI-like enzyme